MPFAAKQAPLPEDPLAGFSDADRWAIIRGERRPSLKSPNRLIRGVSREADGLFLVLERAGGERSLASLVDCLAGLVSPAAAELTKLGLVETVGEGRDRRLRLLPAAGGVVLMSSWSMRD